MRTLPDGQKGIALLLVLVSIVVLAGLTTVSVLLAVGEMRLGRGYVALHQALGIAEGGAAYTVTNWNASAYNMLPVGESLTFYGKAPLGLGSFEGTVTRTGNLTFAAVSAGTGNRREANQRVGLIIRLNSLKAEAQAALTTRGHFQIGPSSLIDGRDRNPVLQNCSGRTDTTIAGVVLAVAGQGTDLLSGCTEPPCLLGAPPVLVDSSISDAELTSISGQNMESLMGLASHVIAGGSIRPAPSVKGETCVTAAPDNWGDPYVTKGPCGDFFPLVFSTGDLRLTGGSGQGTLVVAGDLSVDDGFHFVGFVLIEGKLVSSGTGNRFEGAVVVANRDHEKSRLLGSTAIEYSRCALERAGIGSGRPEVLRERGWFTAY